jgi:deoxycytidylate deaminase
MTPNSDLRKILKYITFMKITEKVGGLSYDMKHQVGSIVVDKDFSNICAVGYNGNYPGGSNERDSMETGQSGFLHAEENAIIQSNLIHGEEYIMFVTMTPCSMCAKRIARKQKGIKEVIALDKYGNTTQPYEILKNAGISFTYLDNKIMGLYAHTDYFRELHQQIKDTDRESLQGVLTNLLFKQLNDFFEFNKTPLENIPLYTLDLAGDDVDAFVITTRYIDVFYRTLYAVL